MFDVDDTTIFYHLKRAGITPRNRSDPLRAICSVNHAVFDVLTPEASYWAGLIFTDGGFQIKPNRTPILSLRLQEDDKDTVLGLSGFLESTYKISRRAAIPEGEGRRKAKAQLGINVLSARIYERFKELGYDRHNSDPIEPLRKSRDFWRGAMDGDGTIDADRGNARIIFGKGRKLTERFLEYMKTVYPQCGSNVIQRPGMWQVRATCRTARALIRDLYYPEALAMSRKANKATEVLQLPSSRDLVLQDHNGGLALKEIT